MESPGQQGDPTIHPKGNQSLIFIGKTDVEAETPILWPPDVKSWLVWKDPDAGKDWGQEEKGMTEDEMVGWHHRLNGHGFGWTLGVGDGQGGLVCCSSWDRKESDTTERLNWTELIVTIFSLWRKGRKNCIYHDPSFLNYSNNSRNCLLANISTTYKGPCFKGAKRNLSLIRCHVYVISCSEMSESLWCSRL